MHTEPIHKVPISVVVLCHNEAGNLPRCIDAVASCGEVVLLDDGSTDNSRAVAEASGARVVEHRFESFADQRNWAMAHADLQYDWVLHLDADEVMTAAALEEIDSQRAVMQESQVGFLPRKMMLGDRWLRFSADYPVYVARLVHRQGPRFVMHGHGEIIDAPDHARVTFREPMLHYAWSKGWADWMQRHARYAHAEALRLNAEGAAFSTWDLFRSDRVRRRRAIRMLSFRLPFRPAQRLIYSYILRGGFLDGHAGLTFSLAMARYERMISRALEKMQKGREGLRDEA